MTRCYRCLDYHRWRRSHSRSLRYFLRDHADIVESEQGLKDICASVQAAIVDVLVGKAIQAAKKLKVSCITAAGGVTANRQLRVSLAEACQRRRIKLKMASGVLCSDNGGMIGALAWLKFTRLGLQKNMDLLLDEEPKPHWDIPCSVNC